MSGLDGVLVSARERLLGDGPREEPWQEPLPGGGHVFLDRRLPFMVVYRHPLDGEDPGTADLVTAFSSHLVAAGPESDPLADQEEGRALRTLIEVVARDAVEHLGGFLLLEIWSEPPRWLSKDRAWQDGRPLPAARLVAGEETPEDVSDAFEDALLGLRIEASNACELGVPRSFSRVDRERGAPAPPGREPLLGPSQRGVGEGELPDGVQRIGLSVTPFYRDPDGGGVFPLVLQALRTCLARAVEDALFHHAQESTSLDAPHPRALARRSIGRAARHVDRRLGEVAGAFDALLQVTPVNTEEAWESFREGRRRPPAFRYRPLPLDPEDAKRRLFHVPIERVEDPLLTFLFREKQEELDRRITLVRELGTPRFRDVSVHLHGGVDDDLAELARRILDTLSVDDTEAPEYQETDSHAAEYVDAAGFAREAREEMDRYRAQFAGFDARVEIRPDVTAGLMVSRGTLMVGETLRVPRHRVRALLDHEVGTHVLTWINGSHQPLRQFAIGLAGYDPLQEGLAVLAEHLAGGLTASRFRILAGRVLGVRALLDGADFVETYDLLHETWGFGPRAAFIMAVRIHRGGGLTKDAAYLRGLRDLLTYLGGEGRMEPLFVGKLGLSHTDAVQELVLRGVLTLPRVKPRFMGDDAAMERFERCRRMTVMDLVDDIVS